MKLSQTPFSYWPVKVGFLLLILALLMSAIGLHKAPVHYSESGTLGVGLHTLGNESFEYNHVYANRTLELSSNNASIIVSWEGSKAYQLNLASNITISPQGRPTVNVISGNVSYTYRVTAWDYPYSFLALPSLISMIMGTMLVFIGYLKLRQGR